MDREDEKNRWAKSLEEAGLLDDLEEEWTLPETVSPGATIKVKGRQGAGARAPGGEPAPFAKPIESTPPPDPRRTPRPKLRPKKPAPSEPRQTGQRLSMGPSAPPVDSTLPPTPVVASPQRPGTRPPEMESTPIARIQKAPPPPKKARSTLSLSNGATPSDTVRGRQISVSPDSRDSASRSVSDEMPAVLMGLEPEEEKAPEAAATPVQRSRISDATDFLQPGADKDLHRRMRERYDLGDYSGALETAEQILKDRPGDKGAAECRGLCQETLMKMYESRIGSFDKVPTLAISAGEIIWRNLNPATGFILSRVDGLLSFEDIVDISGLSRFETCRILSSLLQEGIIE